MSIIRQILSDAPAGFWPLDEASGTTHKDLGSGASAGTGSGLDLANTTLYGNPAPLWNASGDKVSVPNVAALNPTTGLTLEAVYKDQAWSSGNERAIIQKAFTSHANPYYQYFLSLYYTGSIYQLSLYLAIGGTSTSSQVNVSGYAVGVHQVGVTWDGTNSRFYLDGAIVSTPQSHAGTMNTYATPVSIGAYTNVGSGGWLGHLGMVAVHGTALAADRFKARWEALRRYGVTWG